MRMQTERAPIAKTKQCDRKFQVEERTHRAALAFTRHARVS